MSAPCAVAAALIHGRLSAADFEPVEFEGTEAQRLLGVTEVYVDEACERAYPTTRSGVIALRLADGRRIERRVLDPRGEGGNPMSDNDLGGKFLENASARLGGDRAARLLDLVWSADRDADLSAILALLAGE